ncbi:hypothetical protein [Pyxidicoccus caerfyrddinensis]|uniref:hypothetical protein n=1 Tax=Pyxidicoccus caerfyrddinensis TaxID=2709663 RepID=UPI0013D9721C|nr:hypothetical protein [Pyxidicoccus caerfyrddinensis]
MSNLPNITIQISKHTDQELINRLLSALRACDLPFREASMQTELGSSLRMPGDGSPPAGELAETLALNAFSISSFQFSFAQNLYATISRQAGSPTDALTLNLGNYGSNPAQATKIQITNLVHRLRENLRSTDFLSAQGLRSIITPELQRHYELREAAISQLESTINRIASQLTQDARNVRSQLESEYQSRATQLQEEHAQRRRLLDEEIAKERASIAEKETAISEKLKEVDDSKSTHARRQLRQDLKKELAKRSEKFELTQGTRGLRLPVLIFTSALLLISLGGVVAYSYISFRQLTGGSPTSSLDLITTTAKQLAFAVAFASTSVFFLRWNNRWFQSHADEEFRQKRFDLDLDRASWVVEMALEWKEEKGTEIPNELLNRLSDGLFVAVDVKRDEPLHPADQLASAIFGASAGATIELPGGTKVELDRKAINQLKKR